MHEFTFNIAILNGTCFFHSPGINFVLVWSAVKLNTTIILIMNYSFLKWHLKLKILSTLLQNNNVLSWSKMFHNSVNVLTRSQKLGLSLSEMHKMPKIKCQILKKKFNNLLLKMTPCYVNCRCK